MWAGAAVQHTIAVLGAAIGATPKDETAVILPTNMHTDAALTEEIHQEQAVLDDVTGSVLAQQEISRRGRACGND